MLPFQYVLLLRCRIRLPTWNVRIERLAGDSVELWHRCARFSGSIEVLDG